MVETPDGDAARARRSPPPATGSPCWSWAPTTSPRSCTPSTCRAGSPCCRTRSLALLAARATGKVILDGVYNDVQDADGFLAECRQGREMGFDGKTLIHPGRSTAPTRRTRRASEEVEDARGIVRAWEDGAGSGVVTYRGRMVESLHVESARRTLAIDEAISAVAERSPGADALARRPPRHLGATARRARPSRSPSSRPRRAPAGRGCPGCRGTCRRSCARRPGPPRLTLAWSSVSRVGVLTGEDRRVGAAVDPAPQLAGPRDGHRVAATLQEQQLEHRVADVDRPVVLAHPARRTTSGRGRRGGRRWRASSVRGSRRRGPGWRAGRPGRRRARTCAPTP